MTGVCARREAEDHIRAGRVAVNGAVVTDVVTNVDPFTDVIEHDGKRVYPERPMTLVLYKPEGTITTVTDTHGRETVRDLLPKVRERVYPVGRLDQDASGVLLLTNDGELAYRLTHPKYRVKKTYRAWVEGKPSDQALRRLARGIVIEEGKRPTAKARVSLVRSVRGGSILLITVHEGRNHEIKRMCEKIGHPCTKLVRESFAGITLSGLSPGRSRQLSFKELHKLRKMVGIELDGKTVSQAIEQGVDVEVVPPEQPKRPKPPSKRKRKPARPEPPQERERKPYAGGKRHPRKQDTQVGPPAPPPRRERRKPETPEPEQTRTTKRVKKRVSSKATKGAS